MLQKHNCLQLDAKILKKPYVAPMASFMIVTCVMRLLKISLLVGWEIWIGVGSVVAGQNPAYDQFPC